MALSISSDVTISKEELAITERQLLPTTSIGEHGYEGEMKHYLRPYASIDTGNGFPLRKEHFQVRDHLARIEGIGFPFNYPWLPPSALKLQNKLKNASITERQLLRLMEIVSERSSVHFQLTEGKFAAMTFHGRVIEVSDTKVGLLKKIQGQKYREEIFVWKIGSNVFSGRI